MIPEYASRLWWKRFLSRNARSWDELVQFPSLSAEHRRRELARRLLEQICYFGSRADALPEWREAAQIKNPDDLWKIWPSLPIVTKRVLQSNFPGGSTGSRFGIAGRVSSTGGSTGEPVQFFHDWDMVRAAQAASIYSQFRMGWVPGLPTVAIWGSERDIMKQMPWRNRLQSVFRNEFLVDGYKLSDDTVDRVVNIVSSNSPVAIFGFTSMLEFVAQRVLERGIHLRDGCIRAAWNGGEMLYPEQSEVFREAFGVPILNRYGGRELSVMACQYSPSGRLQVMRPWLFLEIVDEAGKPAEPRQTGRLVWTSTVCRGTPFLRYEIGDMGCYEAMDADESGISAIAELHGRSAGLFKLPGGNVVNALYWNHLFKEFDEVRQFQVVLKKNMAIGLRLRGSGMTPAREETLRTIVRNFLGDVDLQISWVNDIPRSAQGKLMQVIREE